MLPNREDGRNSTNKDSVLVLHCCKLKKVRGEGRIQVAQCDTNVRIPAEVSKINGKK